jgi:RNA polymerase sigma factor (TIGR02999 family)
MLQMSPAEPDDITLLLKRMQDGDGDARARLIALVYPELRRMAARRMRGERPDHTLQPTALVHEAFVRLAGTRDIVWENRGHFFALAAEVMRNVLVDSARRRRAVKRGSGAQAKALDDWDAEVYERPDLILDVDRLLARLRAMDARQAQVVEMRFFAGLTEREIADAMDVSERTIKRDWSMARAWMRKELSTQ